MNIEGLIAAYGLWALALGAGLEGESVTILGGIVVHRGLLPIVPAILAASAGSFVADQIFFAIGRRFQDHAYVRRLRGRAAFRRALQAFERHPMLFTFACRFLYGLRTVGPVAIGTTRLGARRFMAINAAAAALWGTSFVTIGYLFGHAIEAAFGRVRAVEHLLMPIAAAAALGAALLYVHRRARAARLRG